jgi:predicted nucleic acid-binding protein
VTALLDTGVLIRYLTLDPPAPAARARELIDNSESLLIPSVALAETAFVLTRLYNLERADVVDLLVALLGRTNLRIIDIPNTRAIEGLLLCRASRRVSFADALIWAATRASGVNVVYTFDQRFPASGLDRRLL